MEGAVACTITKYDIIVRKSFLQFAFGTDNLKTEQETLNSALSLIIRLFMQIFSYFSFVAAMSFKGVGE